MKINLDLGAITLRQMTFVDNEKAFDSVQTHAILTSSQEQGLEDVYIEIPKDIHTDIPVTVHLH